ncbi:MAG: carboxylating nicotinate-nucleotide diphosphorylase [Simkania sp.]|nr:carboxylating nicotinate-nucleotide diphosphorylase [Simkania sp.]
MSLTDKEELSIRRTIDRALSEDDAYADLTTFICIENDTHIEAVITAQQTATVVALFVIPWVFHTLDPTIEIELLIEEGTRVQKGTPLAIIRGKVHPLLNAERTALNLLQHASAVATLTSRFLDEIIDFPCDILDTRKTLPGLRALQKYAVRSSGGKNHGFSLADRILIKDSHLQLLSQDAEEPIYTAIKRAREFKPDAPIEIEITNLDQLEAALYAKADIILLDNMPLDMMRKAVELNQGQAYLEASGRITLDNVRAIASTGVNGISIGALTHSAPAIDINMKFFHLRQEIINHGIHTQRAYL